MREQRRKKGCCACKLMHDYSSLFSGLVYAFWPHGVTGLKMSISSDEVNFLVYRYLQESGIPFTSIRLMSQLFNISMIIICCSVYFIQERLVQLSRTLYRRIRAVNHILIGIRMNPEVRRQNWIIWCYVLKAKKKQKHRHSIRIESKGQKTAEDGVSTAC